MRQKAFAAALRFLARRDYFRRELMERLRRKDFDEHEIESAIARCSELGYLDDHKLAYRFVELRAPTRGWGPRRLEVELRRRGVDRELAGRASRMDPDLRAEALTTALRRVEIRAPEGWWRLHDRRARMISSLLGRGFDTDEAYRAVSALADERERQHDAIDDQCGDPFRLS